MSQRKPKRILVIGINCLPEPTGIGKYTGEMVEWLAEHEYECSVVTAFPYYPQWKIQPPYKGNFYQKELLKEGKLKIYRCPLYVPQNPTGIKRIIHDASFFASAFLMVSYLLFKPGCDYIFCVAPPFHLGFLGLFYRFFKGGEMIYHLQDLQVDAAKDLEIIKSARFISILFALERIVLRQSNRISSISYGMIRKIKQKIDKEIEFFPNWVDTEQFYPKKDDSNNRKSFGFSATDKIVLYSGSIGEKQGLEMILELAKKLENDPAIKFLIAGSGPYKEKLQNAARRMKLKNVCFLPLQPSEKLNSFLNIADVHLVIQKSNAGDLVMPSKLTTILAVGGLALVTANADSGLFEEIKSHEIGILAKAEDLEQLENGINRAFEKNSAHIRVNARQYAEDFLSIDKLLARFVKTL